MKAAVAAQVDQLMTPALAKQDLKLEKQDRKMNWLLAIGGAGALLSMVRLFLAVPGMQHPPAHAPAAAPAVNSGSQHISVGSVSPPAVAPGIGAEQSQKTYYTTEEVAVLEKMAVRTIQDWCARGLIEGATKDQARRKYYIQKDYSILPEAAKEAAELRARED